jgi:hypothetical protein
LAAKEECLAYFGERACCLKAALKRVSRDVERLPRIANVCRTTMLAGEVIPYIYPQLKISLDVANNS